MVERNPDPRDNAQPSTTTSDQPTQDQVSEPVVENKKSDNPYVFPQRQIDMWGDYNMDTAIARAWSRAYGTGNKLGKPTGSEEKLEDDTLVTQDFQYAYGEFQVNDNPNLMVRFYDGNGLIVEDSGL